MRTSDLPAISAIARRVHVAYPERDEVFAERLKLYPAGCHVFERHGRVAGYLISHPWVKKQPPTLDTLLGGLPGAPTTFYIHDLALLPEARGCGAARDMVEEICALADRAGYKSVSLVAVSGTMPFWSVRGFHVETDPHLTEKLATYGEDAAFMVRACGADRRS